MGTERTSEEYYSNVYGSLERAVAAGAPGAAAAMYGNVTVSSGGGAGVNADPTIPVKSNDVFARAEAERAEELSRYDPATGTYAPVSSPYSSVGSISPTREIRGGADYTGVIINAAGQAVPLQPQQQAPREIRAGADYTGMLVTPRGVAIPAAMYAGDDLTPKMPAEYSTYYTPAGSQRQIELKDTRAAYDITSGELAFYQVPINPYTGQPRTGIYGAESGGILIGGGGRASAQSGQFSQGIPLTPWVVEQYNPNVLSPTANKQLAEAVMASPESFSRLGAEAYGGFVLPLDQRTIQSTGVQYGRFPEGLGNLANLVNPQGANISKREYRGANIPWELPPGNAPLLIMSDKGIVGASPVQAYDPKKAEKYLSALEATDISRVETKDSAKASGYTVTPDFYKEPFVSARMKQDFPNLYGFSSVTKVEPSKGELPIVGVVWPISPLVAFFSPSKVTTYSQRTETTPEVTKLVGTKVTEVPGGTKYEQIYETTGGPTTLRTVAVSSAPSRFETIVGSANKFVADVTGLSQIPTPTKEDVGLAIRASPTLTPIALITKAPGLGEYTQSYYYGWVKGAKERPAETLVWGGVGATLGAAGKLGETAFAYSRAAFTGAGMARAAQYTTGLEKSLPYVLGGLYGADVGLRSTEYGRDFSPAAAERLGGITSVEVIPMFAGAYAFAAAPEAIRGARLRGSALIEDIRTPRASQERTQGTGGISQFGFSNEEAVLFPRGRKTIKDIPSAEEIGIYPGEPATPPSALTLSSVQNYATRTFGYPPRQVSQRGISEPVIFEQPKIATKSATYEGTVPLEYRDPATGEVFMRVENPLTRAQSYVSTSGKVKSVESVLGFEPIRGPVAPEVPERQMSLVLREELPAYYESTIAEAKSAREFMISMRKSSPEYIKSAQEIVRSDILAKFNPYEGEKGTALTVSGGIKKTDMLAGLVESIKFAKVPESEIAALRLKYQSERLPKGTIYESLKEPVKTPVSTTKQISPRPIESDYDFGGILPREKYQLRDVPKFEISRTEIAQPMPKSLPTEFGGKSLPTQTLERIVNPEIFAGVSAKPSQKTIDTAIRSGMAESKVSPALQILREEQVLPRYRPGTYKEPAANKLSIDAMFAAIEGIKEPSAMRSIGRATLSERKVSAAIDAVTPTFTRRVVPTTAVERTRSELISSIPMQKVKTSDKALGSSTQRTQYYFAPISLFGSIAIERSDSYAISPPPSTEPGRSKITPLPPIDTQPSDFFTELPPIVPPPRKWPSYEIVPPPGIPYEFTGGGVNEARAPRSKYKYREQFSFTTANISKALYGTPKASKKPKKKSTRRKR